jgi:hypothetical protein
MTSPIRPSGCSRRIALGGMPVTLHSPEEIRKRAAKLYGGG